MKLSKIAFALVSALCVFTFFSCDLLTKPLLEQVGLGDVLAYAPDAENLGNADTTVLANAAGDISIAADPVASRAVLAALGTKAAEDGGADTIRRLSRDQKSNILSLTTSAILPVGQIIGIATDAMKQAQQESGEASESGSSSSGSDESGMQTVIEDMIKAIPFVDTNATEVILLEAVELQTNNDGTYSLKNSTDEDVPAIMLATISVAISACKSSEMVNLETEEGADHFSDAMEDIMSVFDENTNLEDMTDTQLDTLANDILEALSSSGEADEKGSRALGNAFKVLRNLGKANVEVSGEALMGMFTGGMMNN